MLKIGYLWIVAQLYLSSIRIMVHNLNTKNDQCGQHNCADIKISNSYIMVCPHVRGDNVHVQTLLQRLYKHSSATAKI